MIKDNLSEMIRRTEIMARTMNGEIHSKADLAELFNVSEITINRDLNWLRDCGIQIYSGKGTVRIMTIPENNLLNDIAADYLPVILSSDVFLRQVKLFSKSGKSGYFEFLILLARAVHDGLIVKVKYKRLSDSSEHDYTLRPVRLLADRLNWQLHAFKDGEDVIKTFYLSRIESLSLTAEKFSQTAVPVKKEIIHKMIFKFPGEIENEVLDKIWFNDYELEREENGDVLLITCQPVTNSLAAWCISWWDKIEILEPSELIDYTEDMIRCFSKVNIKK